MKPYQKLLLALILGAMSGSLFHTFAADSQWIIDLNKTIFDSIGQIFLRTIFMVVVPIVFCGLVLGVYQLSQHQGLGKVVGRTLMFTVLASTASVLIGITLVNLIQPGVGLKIPENILAEQTAQVEKIKTNASAASSFSQAVVELVPKNPIASAVRALEGEMLAVMVFSLIFGIGLSRSLKLDSHSTLISALEQVYGASMEVVHLAMKFAPMAVFCLVFSSAFKFGSELLISLAYYVFVVILGLAIQQFGIYTLLLKTFSRIRPLDFFKKTREVMIYAFATASSNATLPRTLECATEQLKLKPETSRFVLTVGSTANQNGTALFEGITVLFLAQVYGIDLSFAAQTQVVLMSILAGIGTAGVPGGSLPLIMILLQQVGIPPEGLGIVLGVDRLLDMCRTAINVSGDLVIAALVDEKR